ncbi:helix-turn-helix domain-containing protein [Sporosarcina sp. ACRSL]|nr:helix-turn-helix domain-containing protein [Sporosarcina sp. ACRSL]
MRKQRKMTLETLAGDQLTKGMLSLIENNKANPSMESLSYIAERLGVEVSELLEEVSTQELREVLEKTEKLYNTEFDKLTDEYQQIIALIDPYADSLTQGYEAARLLEIYSRSLHVEKKEGWQEYSDKAAQIYDQLNIIPRRSAIGIFRSLVKFTEHNYESALATLLKERSDIEARNVFIDPMTRLDFDYMEAALHYAVGDAKEAIRVMNNGIEFSKEKQVFYRIDHLYRLAVFHAMMTGDEEAMKYYVRKIELYGEFADDEEAVYFPTYVRTHYLTSYKKSYEEALDLINSFTNENELANYQTPYFYMEKGKVLYGLEKYEEAIECFQSVTIADYVHHPFDLSIFYEKDAYTALCHLALGEEDKAVEAIDKAVENITPMPRTPYKDFIMDTYELIQNS